MREVDAGMELGAEASGPVPGRGWTEAALGVMVVVWGVNFSVVKFALVEIDPLAFNALRFVLASVLVGAVLRWRGELALPARADVPRVLLLGLVGNLFYQMCFILGLDRTLAGSAAVMLALTPVMTAFLSMLQGDERPGVRTWGGVALTVLGVALVSGASFRVAGREAVIGNFILIGASAAWAAYTVGANPIVRRYGSVATTAWTMWTGTVGLVLVGAPAALRQDWGGVSAAAWGGLVFSGAFSIALAYLIWYRGVERIGSTRTAVFANLTPVVALFAAVLLLGEPLGVLPLVGVALTLGGVWVVRGDPGGGAGSGTKRA